jgi:hypothetical protein
MRDEKGTIMLQHREIKKRFARIEREIEDADGSCQADSTLPQQLKDYVTQLKQHTSKVKSILESQDYSQVVRFVDDMEEIGERAEVAIRNNVGVDDNLRKSVVHAHVELSNLKKKLH